MIHHRNTDYQLVFMNGHMGILALSIDHAFAQCLICVGSGYTQYVFHYSQFFVFILNFKRLLGSELQAHQHLAICASVGNKRYEELVSAIGSEPTRNNHGMATGKRLILCHRKHALFGPSLLSEVIVLFPQVWSLSLEFNL